MSLFDIRPHQYKEGSDVYLVDSNTSCIRSSINVRVACNIYYNGVQVTSYKKPPLTFSWLDRFWNWLWGPKPITQVIPPKSKQPFYITTYVDVAVIAADNHTVINHCSFSNASYVLFKNKSSYLTALGPCVNTVFVDSINLKSLIWLPSTVSVVLCDNPSILHQIRLLPRNDLITLCTTYTTNKFKVAKFAYNLEIYLIHHDTNGIINTGHPTADTLYVSCLHKQNFPLVIECKGLKSLRLVNTYKVKLLNNTLNKLEMYNSHTEVTIGDNMTHFSSTDNRKLPHQVKFVKSSKVIYLDIPIADWIDCLNPETQYVINTYEQPQQLCKITYRHQGYKVLIGTNPPKELLRSIILYT